jgi:ATP-dependent helicase HrpA
LIKNRIEKIESLLPQTLAADRHKIRVELVRLKQSRADSLPTEKIQKRLDRIEARLKSSVKKRSWRLENRPQHTYLENLPITAKKDEIVATISKHQVVIISGETGSGKTTQIPKFCLAAGRGIDAKIGCTQPRRIAATMVARRIAEELGEELGRSVGYKIRFKDRTRRDSFIKIMTDGILLAEAQSDANLSEYDTLIVDEAHERSLNIDFVLGILKTLLKKRKDLKVIITSATIDTKKFSKAFNDAPVIEVSGRMYPVEVRYFLDEPALRKTLDKENGEQTHIEMAVRAVDRLNGKNHQGDILLFMPTEQDIRETCDLLEGRNYSKTTVLPLYARLSASEQTRVFSRRPGRKIIVATNVAETSLTIPGIKYVIDTGLARISQYNPRSRTNALPVLPISRSSADQRKGRCGRVANGVCIRLFSEEDFQSRSLFTLPEIQRSNLAEVILRMIALNLGDISDFPFIDKPALKNIKDGFDLLKELGAITEATGMKPSSSNGFSLTAKGKLMAQIPIDPRLSRMLIEAQKEECLNEIVVIAAALSIQDPRERPTEEIQEADRVHALFHDPSSDFLTLLNIWRGYHDTWRQVKRHNPMKKYCKAHYLSYKRMREWRDIHAQIGNILEECGISYDPNSTSGISDSDFEHIHKSILSGFLSNIAQKKDKNRFQAAKGREAMIFPGSVLFNKAKAWIVAAEMVETTRLFARTVANIDSSWLEALGKSLCKFTYLHPHWERKRGEVLASEQVSLFGLIIDPGRPVSYGRINPDEASDIFIRDALVNGDVKQPFPFMAHNQKLIENAKDMEDRIRRRDILVGEEELFLFYNQRLAGVYDIRTLQKYIKEKGNDIFLRMNQTDPLRYLPTEELLSQFPDRIVLGINTFECNYHFQPGEDDDGLTVKVPSALTPTILSDAMDWLIPGLFQEKVTALIKGLPKEYRKKLVPIADTVNLIIRQMPRDEGSLITALGNFIHQRFSLQIPATAWPDDILPDHLKMRISIRGPKDEELRSGRDKSILTQDVARDIGLAELETEKKRWEKTGIIRWDFGDLPDSINIKINDAADWTVYPGLESNAEHRGTLNLRLFRHRDRAIQSHKNGVAALFSFHFAKDLKFLKKNLTLPHDLKEAAQYFGGAKQFEKKLYDRVIRTLFNKNIRSEKAFSQHAQSVSSIILSTGKELLDSVIPVITANRETRSLIYDLENSNRNNNPVKQFLNSLKDELMRLVPESFTDLYDGDRLVQIERYVKAVGIRAQRAAVDFEKDLSKAEEFKIFTKNLVKLLKTLSPSVTAEKRKAIEEFFWLIEEYKVSLFAQELKTAIPVSKKRLNKKLEEIKRMI